MTHFSDDDPPPLPDPRPIFDNPPTSPGSAHISAMAEEMTQQFVGIFQPSASTTGSRSVPLEPLNPETLFQEFTSIRRSQPSIFTANSLPDSIPLFNPRLATESRPFSNTLRFIPPDSIQAYYSELNTKEFHLAEVSNETGDLYRYIYRSRDGESFVHYYDIEELRRLREPPPSIIKKAVMDPVNLTPAISRANKPSKRSKAVQKQLDF